MFLMFTVLRIEARYLTGYNQNTCFNNTVWFELSMSTYHAYNQYYCFFYFIVIDCLDFKPLTSKIIFKMKWLLKFKLKSKQYVRN